MPLLRKIARIALAVLGILCMVTVIFSITARDRWWIRIFDYPRAQIAGFSVVVLVLSLIFLDRKVRWAQIYLGALTAAVLWQGYVLYPYFLPVQPAAPERAISDPQCAFRLLEANVLMENQDVQSYLDLVERTDPDVLVVIEPNERWTEQLAPLRQRYEHYVEQPQDNHYGMNLYSRFPLSGTEIHYFEHTGTPSIHTVITLPSGDEVEIYSTHPRPPLPENSVSAADKELIKIAQRVQEIGRPVVVTGDFNDVPWSYTVELFQEISELRDFRVGRGFYNTYGANNLILRLPLDHISVSPGLGLAEIADPIAFSSDHMALLATLVVDECAP